MMNRQSFSSLTLCGIKQRIGLRVALRLVFLVVLAATGVATSANGQAASASAGLQPFAIATHIAGSPLCPGFDRLSCLPLRFDGEHASGRNFSHHQH